MAKFISKSREETQAFAASYAKTLRPFDVVLLDGDMGAGKTVFSKGGDAVEAMEQVEAAEVSYQAGTAIVTLKEEVCDEVLKKTIEEQGYPVLSIQ